MRESADRTLQYVIGLANSPAGRIAAVSIANYGFVPSTGPREGSGAIYREGEDGAWTQLPTGTTFDGVALDALLTSPDGRIVLFGHAADNAAGPVAGVWTSVDGTTWTASDATWLRQSRWPEAAIAGGPSGYVQAGEVDGAVEVYWSDDALTWERVHTMQPADVGAIIDVRAVAAGAEGFVIAVRGYDGPLIIASGDGRSWFPADASLFGSNDIVMSIAPIGPDWVAAGWGGEDSAGIEIWRSADGLQWDLAGSIQPPTSDLEPFGSRVMYPSHLVSTGDRLVLSAAYAVEGSETRPLWVWTSTDGVNWELLELGGDAEVRAVLPTECCIWLGGRIGRNSGEAAIWRWEPEGSE